MLAWIMQHGNILYYISAVCVALCFLLLYFYMMAHGVLLLPP